MRPGLSAVFGLFLLASASPVQGDETKAKYEAAADYSAGLGGRALLVMVDGKVVYERYDRGWAAERPHPLASGTKSFSGVLAAAAIQDRIIESWDARVSDTIRPWQGDPLKRDITVQHLLSLSSGLDPADPALESPGGGAVLGEAAARRSERIAKSGVAQADDKHAAALAARMTGRPGQQFEYGAAHFYAFGAYLEARLAAADVPQKTVEAYFTARIAEPMGLKVGRWGRDRRGHVNLPGGMQLTAREWAKLGELVRLAGAVRGEDGSLRQVITPDLLAECFKPSANNPQYGLSWWLPSGDGDTDAADVGINPDDPGRRRRQAEQMRGFRDASGQEIRVDMAAGLGKQRLIVLPDHRTVIVRFAEATREGLLRYSDAKLVGLIMGWPAATAPPAGQEQADRP
jgi:CubicO group peptidase (beta-lactamase class C family)